MLQETVLAYMLRESRAYSCNDITVGLGEIYSKEEVKKALRRLAIAGRIQCALHGLEMFYLPISYMRPEVNNYVIDAIVGFDIKAISFQHALANEPLALKVASDNLKSLLVGQPTESLNNEMEKLDNFITSSLIKLEMLMQSTNNITTDTLKHIMNE